MSIRNAKPPRMIQNVFVLLLLALFAAMSTLLVTLGAQVYRGTVERANRNNEARILSAVVRSAIWAEDGQGQVQVEDQDGLPVLAIENNYDGEVYVKRLYCHKGQLVESFTSAGYEFDPAMGESICQAESFLPELSGGFLKVTLQDANGQQSTVQLQLRSASPTEE